MNQPSAGSLPTPEARRKQRAALLSVAATSALALLKLTVGLLIGSISVLSEALHSATDLVASGITLISVRTSDSPPDEEHPYGHGKIESIAGLAEAAFITIAAAFIVSEAISRLHTGRSRVEDTGPGLAVMALSATANILISGYLRSTGRQLDSPALRADAAHLRTDAVASLGVLAGLTLVRYTGYGWIDPVAALLVAVLILQTAFVIGRGAILPLIDTRLPEAEEAAIRTVLQNEPEVLGYHKLRTRKSGSQRHADVHVLIDDNFSLVHAHNLTESLEDRIRSALPSIHVSIHIEPYHQELKHQRDAHGADLESLAGAGSQNGAGSALRGYWLRAACARDVHTHNDCESPSGGAANS
ncbi:MAG TPA: cation diffusion facilitator family transporter [Chthonomonadales bacterium]|nr:cation diffusion facilitator family transporter [Chthonomonadales bacterium]